MEQEDSFLESFESLLDTIKRLVVKPVKRVTGFASLGFLLIVLLFLSLIFIFIGIIKIMQGLGLLLGVNPTGFAFASLGILFLFLSVKSYWRKKGILGITRNYGFLQRFGIVKKYQNSGLGKKLLEDVVAFSKQKKLVNVRLNTQTQNKHAQNLYLNNGFVYTKTNFLILATSNHK